MDKIKVVDLNHAFVPLKKEAADNLTETQDNIKKRFSMETEGVSKEGGEV